jgi:hypothetical protein
MLSANVHMSTIITDCICMHPPLVMTSAMSAANSTHDNARVLCVANSNGDKQKQGGRIRSKLQDTIDPTIHRLLEDIDNVFTWNQWQKHIAAKRSQGYAVGRAGSYDGFSCAMAYKFPQVPIPKDKSIQELAMKLTALKGTIKL